MPHPHGHHGGHHIPGFQSSYRYGPYPYGFYPFPQPLVYVPSEETYCPVHGDQCPANCPYRKKLYKLGYPGLQGDETPRASKGKCLAIGAIVIGALWWAFSD